MSYGNESLKSEKGNQSCKKIVIKNLKLDFFYT